MKKALKCLLLSGLLLLCLALPSVRAHADATDVIEAFNVTVDVNEDASLRMQYEIIWKVLDDEAYGPLEWIDLGVPNDHHTEIKALSQTIDHIEDNGDALAIYLDRSYYADETVTVSFSMTQDYMYQIDKFKEGETVYTFTPAWFDGMDIRKLTIRWNAENAASWQPDSLKDQGYLVFSTAVAAGDQYTVSVTYPNAAFGFSTDRQAGGSSGEIPLPDNYGGEENCSSGDSFIGTVLELLFGGMGTVFIAGPIVLISLLSRFMKRGRGFGSSEATEKKITRTKIEYFANCPSCGAVRQEGKDNCPYCGRSMIKSKEVVEESQLEHPENYEKNGTYRYGDSPNVFIHVNVVNIPVHRSVGSTRSHSGSSHRSSCASSSCACACVSSCACACACASSGRAGCSVKDFFRKSLHKGRIRVSSGE